MLANFFRHGLTFRPQTSSTDCGAACLAMILNYYGCRRRVSDLAAECSAGRSGITAASLERVASLNGVRLQGHALSIDELSSITTPAVLHWGFEHWVVLESFHRNFSVTILDPALGRRRVERKELSDKFTGVALLPKPPATRAFSLPSSSSSRFWAQFTISRTKSLWRIGLPLTAMILVATALAQILGVAVAFLTGALFSEVTLLGGASLLGLLGLGILAVLVMRVALEQLRAVAVHFARCLIDGSLLVKIVRHILRLPFPFFLARGAGELQERVHSYFFIRQLLTDDAASACIDLFFAGIYEYALFTVSHSAALAAAVCVVLVLAVALGRYAPERDLLAVELEAETEKSRRLFEILRGAKRLKASGLESEAITIWSSALNRHINAAAARGYLSAMWDGFGLALQGMLPLVVIYIGAVGVIGGHNSVGTVLTELFLTTGLLAPLGSVARTTHQFRVAGAYWNRVSDLVLTPAERSGNQDVGTDGDIELCDVTFTYPGEPSPALKNVSCKFERGQTTAVVGVSGSGKSTLISVLLGLFIPQSGKVLSGGKPIDEGNLEAYRQRLGIVLQDETIFDGSIFSNIALGCKAATLEEVVSAAKAAILHEEILKMPAGYETYVGEDGRNLSGGQRQRLALARALVRRPKLLILDEATSNLDEDSCAKVDQSLGLLTCTRIVITHRLSLVRDANKILVLHAGKIEEGGSHEELLRARRMYSKLWDAQMVGAPNKNKDGSLAGTF